MTRIALVMLVAALIGCAERSPPRAPAADDPIPLEHLLEDPEAFDGRAVRVRAGYYAEFDTSVLTAVFADSYPPQPAPPLVWIGVSPDGPCVEQAGAVGWAEDVIATGTFRFDPEGGLGHLGRYTMELADPEVACA